MELLFYLIHVPLLAWVAWRLWRRDQEHPLRKFYWPALGLKLGAAMLLGILYSGFYNTYGDTFAYVIDARSLNEVMLTDFSSFCKIYFQSESNVEFWQKLAQDEPRYWMFLRLIYPLGVLCGLQYWIITSWLTLFCFDQLYRLSASVLKYYNLSKSGVLIALLLMPSVVYWSAGLSKETLAVAIIAYLVCLVLHSIHEQKTPTWWNGVLAMVGVYLLWTIKFYYIAVLLPCLLLWYVLYLNGIKKWLVFGGALVLLMAAFAMGNANLSPDRFAEVVYQNYTQTILASDPGSYFIFAHLKPSLISLVQYFPSALWYGCFTPQLWQAHYSLAYFAAIENTVVLIVFLALLWHWKHWTWHKETTVILLYVFVLAGLLALASPNWGSLLRYKVAFEPYALLLLLGVHPWMKRIDAFLFKPMPA